MSERVKCGSCQGTFAPIQADGLRYFHACAPVSADGGKTYTERLDKRDENVTLDAAGRCVAIRAEGKGVTPSAAGPGP